MYYQQQDETSHSGISASVKYLTISVLLTFVILVATLLSLSHITNTENTLAIMKSERTGSGLQTNPNQPVDLLAEAEHSQKPLQTSGLSLAKEQLTTEELIEALSADLYSSSLQLRRDALNELSNLGLVGVPYIGLALLSDADPGIREYALHVLSSMPFPSAEAFIRLISQDSSSPLYAQAQSLIQLTPDNQQDDDSWRLYLLGVSQSPAIESLLTQTKSLSKNQFFDEISQLPQQQQYNLWMAVLREDPQQPARQIAFDRLRDNPTTVADAITLGMQDKSFEIKQHALNTLEQHSELMVQFLPQLGQLLFSETPTDLKRQTEELIRSTNTQAADALLLRNASLNREQKGF